MSCAFAFCKKGSSNGTLKRCGRCKIRNYCSAECQTKDWPSHKVFCNEPTHVEKELAQKLTDHLGHLLKSPELLQDMLNDSKEYMKRYGRGCMCNTLEWNEQVTKEGVMLQKLNFKYMSKNHFEDPSFSALNQAISNYNLQTEFVILLIGRRRKAQTTMFRVVKQDEIQQLLQADQKDTVIRPQS